MADPLAREDPLLGVYRYLLTRDGLVDRLGAFGNGSPWLFREDLGVQVESTSKEAVLVKMDSGEWTSPSVWHTTRYPVVTLEVWSDPSRHPDGDRAASDGKRKARALFWYVDRFLHRPYMRAEVWGRTETDPGVLVAWCQRTSGPTLLPVGDGDGLYFARADYGLVVE